MTATTTGTRVCPFCAETIKADAKVCRFCGRELPAATPPQRAGRSLAPPQEPRIVKGVNRYFTLLGWIVLGALALWMYRSCFGG